MQTNENRRTTSVHIYLTAQPRGPVVPTGTISTGTADEWSPQESPSVTPSGDTGMEVTRFKKIPSLKPNPPGSMGLASQALSHEGSRGHPCRVRLIGKGEKWKKSRSPRCLAPKWLRDGEGLTARACPKNLWVLWAIPSAPEICTGPRGATPRTRPPAPPPLGLRPHHGVD